MAIGVFTEQDARKVASATSITLSGKRSVRNMLRVSWMPPRSPGGVCACVTVWAMGIRGGPSGGSFSCDVTIDTGSGLDTDTLSFNFDDIESEIQTTLETHSGIAASGVDVDVKFGTFPYTDCAVVFL